MADNGNESEPDDVDPDDVDPAMIARELRRLWDVDRLDDETLARLAPNTVEILGFGEPRLALQNLEDMLTRYSDDKYFGSLMAAVGLFSHHLVRGNVTERLADFGEHVLKPPRSGRQVRRYAEIGAEIVMRQVTAFEPSVDRPTIRIMISRIDAVSCKALISVWANDVFPIVVSAEAHEGEQATLSSVDGVLDEDGYYDIEAALRVTRGKDKSYYAVDLTWISADRPWVFFVAEEGGDVRLDWVGVAPSNASVLFRLDEP